MPRRVRRVSTTKRPRTIGIVTEGRGEVLALPNLYQQIKTSTGVRLINPIFAPANPLGSELLIARSLSTRVRLAFERGADKVIVLLDSERSWDCPGRRAQAIGRELHRLELKRATVVIKHSKFENWLIADLDALSGSPRLFTSKGVAAYAPGCADQVDDAESMLKSLMRQGHRYSKIDHPAKILKCCDITVMRQNSRSFDKFLREIA